MKKTGIDEFGVKRNICACGKFAYWWNGEKFVCYGCLKKEREIEIEENSD